MSLTVIKHKEYQRVYSTIPSYDIFFNNTCGVKPIATSYKELANHMAKLGNAQSVENTLYYVISNYRSNRKDKKIMELLMKNVAQKTHGEVFTPSSLVEEILDEFESRNPEFFKNPNHTVLDFAAGCGNLLKGVINRFFNGTRNLYANDKECMHHILKYQIYAVEVQPNNYKMLCVNLDYENLVPNNPHFICADARGFDYWDMMYNFDMVFINPPYSISNGNESGKKYKDVYQIFSKLAHNISKRYVINIIPSKFLYGDIDSEFKNFLFDTNNVVYMKTYFDHFMCFKDASVTGGILWYISDKKYNSSNIYVDEIDYYGNKNSGVRDCNEFSTYPRSIVALNVIRKINNKINKFFNEVCMGRNVFDIETNVITDIDESELTYKVMTNAGTSQNTSGVNFFNIDKKLIKKNLDVIDDYKFVIVRAGSMNLGKNKKLKIVSPSSRVVDSGVLFSNSFLCVSHNKNLDYVYNVKSYFKTKFVGYLMWNAMGNQNISKEKMCFVPVMDFTQEWNDEKLYKFFNLTKEEIEVIEQLIDNNE